MPAPAVYFVFLTLYMAIGGAFCLGCLVVALLTQFRSVAFRAAIAMIATYPGVLLYQLISLPFMVALFILGMLAVNVVGASEHPNAVVIFAGALFIAFGGISLAGFISGWRVAWASLNERSLLAGLRRDLVMASLLWLWRHLRKITEQNAPPNGGPSPPSAKSRAYEGPPSVS